MSSVPTAGRVGGVEWVATGTGLPVTVFAHGLAGTAAEVRPLASRTPGTRVALSFRGHGGSAPLVDGWDFDLLADDLLAVADATGATRAVGLSLGAGALLRLLVRDPHRFERIAFVMPASLDELRDDRATDWLMTLAAAMDADDLDGVTELLLAEVPAAVRHRTGARLLVERRARQLTGTPPPRPRGPVRPLHDLAPLAAVSVPALVIGQADDDLHPLSVAQRLASALPDARLVELPQGGVFWTAGRETADLLAAHLAEPAGVLLAG